MATFWLGHNQLRSGWQFLATQKHDSPFLTTTVFDLALFQSLDGCAVITSSSGEISICLANSLGLPPAFHNWEEYVQEDTLFHR
jgi:dipeptide/tripeptide permease